jgi:hypothetical protein
MIEADHKPSLPLVAMKGLLIELALAVVAVGLIVGLAGMALHQ